MNTDRNMQQWLPCQSRCELAGAAAFFLSITESAVLINGPRWCAMIAEREMAGTEKKYERRIFCSEMAEIDLLYGADDVLPDALAEVHAEQNPALIAVLNSCSVSLIGDDLAGICRQARTKCLVLPMDAGGLRGEFWTGYQDAAIKLLEALPLNKLAVREKMRVNIIGWCTCYPNWQGDLIEIKRMLKEIGLEVGVCLGADETSFDSLLTLPQATCNLVLYPELGEKIAAWLKNFCGQDTFIAPIPYGMHGSLIWLESVAKYLGLSPDFTRLATEVRVYQEKTDAAIFQIKVNNKNIAFGDAYIALPYGVAIGVIKAMQEEFPDIEDIYLRIEGPLVSKKVYDVLGVKQWERNCQVDMKPQAVHIVIGNAQTRVEAEHYQQVVFKNMLLPIQSVVINERPYAGIRGWRYLLAELLDGFQTMVYLNPTTSSGNDCI